MTDFLMFNYWGNLLLLSVGIYLLYVSKYKTEKIRDNNSASQPLMSAIFGGIGFVLLAICYLYMNLFDKW